MNRPDVKPGDVVVSRAGRDEGRYFAVLSLEGEEFAMLTDGGLRDLARPKRKRIRHTKSTGLSLSPESMQNDAGIRKALTALKPNKEG